MLDGLLLKNSLLRVREQAFLSLNAGGTDQLNLPDGSWIELTPQQAAAIELFAVPRTLESGVMALQRRLPGDDPDASLATVMELVEANAIERFAFSTAEGSNEGRGAGMFGCPASCVEDALSGQSCDVVFFGVPYELGVTGGKGTRTGPAYVRRCSRVAFDYVENAGVPTGWWNVADRHWLLEGVRFCDVGDVPCAGAERNGEPFDMLYELQLSLLRAGRFPVAVGGDHSVSLPLITGAALSNPGLRVIQFDAHSDMGSHEDGGDWRQNCSHGNFMSWVAGNPNVAGIIQIGVRNLLSEPPFQSPKVVTYPQDTFLRDGEAIVASWPDGPYYLTFDVDCLDPMAISQTGTPIPGGFDYREVSRALELICKRLRIVGIDFVELIEPEDERDFREGSTIAHLMFLALANIFKRRRGNGQSGG